MTVPVDPQIQAMLDRAAGLPPTNTLPVAEARARYEALTALRPEAAPVAAIAEVVPVAATVVAVQVVVAVQAVQQVAVDADSQ